MKPYYQDDAATIYLGDASLLLPTLEADTLLTDPDYGVGMKYGAEPLGAEQADALGMTPADLDAQVWEYYARRVHRR